MPKLRPNYFSLCGLRFSDKSWAYALGLQLALAEGTRSGLPMLGGALFGALYMANGLRLQALTWPRPVRGACRRLVLPLLDSGPPQPPGAAAAGGRGGARRRGGGYEDDDGAAAAIAAVAALNQQHQRGLGGAAAGGGGGGAGAGGGGDGFPPPDPAAVQRLCALGFDRPAVEAALREAFGDENAAANRLLGG